jgi:hypothetical protein
MSLDELFNVTVVSDKNDAVSIAKSFIKHLIKTTSRAMSDASVVERFCSIY